MPGLFVDGQRSFTGWPSHPLGACASNRLLASTMSGRWAAPWRERASMWSARSNPPVSPGCVATLHTNTTRAPDAAIASRIPGTTRAGRRLVNRLPGPMTMSSASAMAWSASSVGWTSSGVTQTRSTRLVRAIRLCPVTWVPSSSCA